MSPAGAQPAAGFLDRRYVFVCYALVLVTLLAGTTPVLVGDGYEYVGMTMQMARLRHPAMTAEQAAAIEYSLSIMEPSFRHFDLIANKRSDAAGRYDQMHFWFYSLAAVPAYWVVSLVGGHANYSFSLLNIALLLAAFWIVSARLDTASRLLLFCGPVIWFIDKAHTEIFTFALLAATFGLITVRPWWAIVCLGAASTQAPPIAGLVPLAAIVAIVADRSLLRQRRFWSGALAGVTLAGLAPLYYRLRHGVYQIIVPEIRWPTAAEVAAPIWDPTIGLVGNDPVFLLVTCICLIYVLTMERPQRRDADVWLSVGALALFLPAFAQTNNFNHGAKLGLTRYALWLMPLAIPWLLRGARLAPTAWSRAVMPLVLLTSLWSLFANHPATPEGLAATRLSAVLWDRFPGFDNPIPEVFAETTWRTEEAPFPAATANCSKVLLLDGVWPIPCPPQEVPDECRGPEAICYANRRARGYEFAPAGRAFGYPTLPETMTWPRGAGNAFTPWLAEPWWEARSSPAGGDASMVRDTQDVERWWTYEGDDSLLVYFQNPGSTAIVQLRIPWRSSGFFVDPTNGDRIAPVSGRLGPGGGPWPLSLPQTEGRDVVLVLSRSADPEQ